MATFGEALSDIKRRATISGTARDTEIGDALRQALLTARGLPYWFLEKTGDVTLAAGASSVTVPADLDMPITVDLVGGGARYTHKNRTFTAYPYERFKSLYLTQSTLPTGRPVANALVNRTLYLSHTADQAYTLSFFYTCKDASLPTLEGQTSVWLDEGYDYIVQLALYIYEKEIKKNPEASDTGLLLAKKRLDTQHGMREQGAY